MLAGLAVGALHAFEPDHIAAVSTRMTERHDVSEQHRRGIRRILTRSSILGAFWGVGHAIGISIMGLLVVFSSVISDGLFAGLNLAVGLMLVLLGIFAVFNRGMLGRTHVHPHQHADGTIHTHRHTHGPGHTHGHSSYVIGFIHGLAGSGALVALFASGLDMEKLAYFLAMFGVGSVAGMMLASGIIGLPLAIQSRFMQKLFRYVTSFVAVVIGAGIIYQTVSGQNVLPL